MNILFLYIRMFHPCRGGIERVTDLLCKEFKKNGHNVFYLNSVCDEELLDYAYPASLTFFPNSSVTEEKENGLFYREFLERNNIDIVINQDPYSYYNLCAYSKGLEHIHTISVIHTNPLFIYGHLGQLTLRLRDNSLIEKIKRIARIIKIPYLKHKYLCKLRETYEGCFRNSDFVCLLSAKFLPELEKIELSNFDLNRVIAIPDPNTYPRQASLPEKKKQILYVGRITWFQKRVERLIPIWNKLYRKYPDWELVIVGDGPQRMELEAKSKKLENIKFVGFQDPATYYKEARILCLTSDSEGWGMVLSEAMTFGTIPIAFNSYASVTDIIEDGKTGLLVRPFSIRQFANKLQTLMADEELRMRMSEACEQSVHRFDIQNIANCWENVFYKLKNK